jgi:hypothetical protein
MEKRRFEFAPEFQAAALLPLRCWLGARWPATTTYYYAVELRALR